LVLPPVIVVWKERASSPSPDTVLKFVGNFELYAEMYDDGMPWITSMITFTPDVPPTYSQTIPEAPAGSSVEPPPLMPTAFGSPDVPRAESTVLPEGHDEEAVVVVGSATVGAAVAGGAVAAGVGVDPEPELAAGDELPQAARVAAAASVASGIQYELLRVTCDASVIRSMSVSPGVAL
jgi:hypothetical protein